MSNKSFCYQSFIHWIVVLFSIALFPISGAAQEQLHAGLVAARPDHGPYVETDRGFMVPYEARIPGTDAAIQMVPIPGGRLLIGSPETEPGRKGAEGPQVSVIMEPFWMGKYEVTWREYGPYMRLVRAFKAFDRRGIRLVTEEVEVDVVTAPSVVYDPDLLFDGGEGLDTPAVTMTQFSARQYSKWLSLLLEDFYRLPSEAEWEYACRAGTITAYSFGDDASKLSDYGWFNENSQQQRHDVGLKLPNAWGLYDMHGNVAEWVLDAFTPDGYIAIGDGMVPSEDAIQWPSEVYPRVARGGSWELSATALRSASRLASDRDWSDNDPGLPNSPWWHTSFPSTGVGFRIVRPLSAPATVAERERFWGADNEDIQDAVNDHIEISGRGSQGFVDPELPAAIRLLDDEDR